MKRVAFTGPSTAAVIESRDLLDSLKPTEIRGRTLVSLVSPGTELNSGYLGSVFPSFPGYASVFEIEETGRDVTDLAGGDIVFGSGNHSSLQQAERSHVLPLPPGLTPEVAVFARLAGVSMSTLNTTSVRPPARVLVTGLGPVGLLAAQIFSLAGYQVAAVDPSLPRQDFARELGLPEVSPSVEMADVQNKIDLHIECSGHEQAVVDGASAARKGGEVFLVGVPWQRQTELTCFDLSHIIFHRYVTIRSGWEWQVPLEAREFSSNSIRGNLATALVWLQEGRLNVRNMANLYLPEQAQEVYSGLLDQSINAPTAIFDWRSDGTR